MLVYGRDGRLGPRLKHLFQGTFRNPESNKLTGVYEVVLKRAIIGSPGSFVLAVKMPSFASFLLSEDRIFRSNKLSSRSHRQATKGYLVLLDKKSIRTKNYLHLLNQFRSFQVEFIHLVKFESLGLFSSLLEA